VGFGNVGRALLRLLISKEMELRRKYDVRWRLTGVATRRIGWLANPDGLNPIAAISGHFPGGSQPARDVYEWLERAKADVLFELTSLNAPTGQPAIEHLIAALKYGAHAITANKGPIVHAYREWQQTSADEQAARELAREDSSFADEAAHPSPFPIEQSDGALP